MHDFTILVLPGAYASSVSVTLDILEAAARLAPRTRAPRPTWRVVSPAGGDASLSSGLRLATERAPLRARADASTWILPGLGTDNPQVIAERLARADAQRAIAAVRGHAARGGAVAASCSAVFLLQAAGLLAGRRATTSWWLAPELCRLAPDCVVDAGRMVCADGAITTGGAALAQSDLMLHLLRARCGNALVESVSRTLLIDGRQAQAPFVVPEMLASGDDLVARLAARIDTALPHAPGVRELASAFCMSERTLSRHVRRATGKSTLALVQSVRMRRARALLEGSRMTVDQVAEAVGYQDSTALRRLMKKIAGANPSRYRPAVAT